MPLRVLNYVVQFWQSLQSGPSSLGSHCPPYSRLCLYNGDQKWNAATEILECIENVGDTGKVFAKNELLSD